MSSQYFQMTKSKKIVFEVHITNKFEESSVLLESEELAQALRKTYKFGLKYPKELFDDPEYVMEVRKLGGN